MKIGTDNVLFINYLCISKRLICEFRNVNVKRDESNWVEHDYQFALPMEIILHTSLTIKGKDSTFRYRLMFISIIEIWFTYFILQK